MAPKKTTPASTDVPVVQKTKTPKNVPAPVPEPVPEPIVELPPAAEPVSEEAVSSPMALLEEKIALLSATFKEVNIQVRLVKKEIDRLRRIADRVEKKKASAKSSPNGFAKASKITDELCVFLGVPSGSERSRTDVTREIHKYVQANELSDPKNKRIILAHKDAKLKALLGSTDKDEISYFNLQKFLKHHFIKPTPVVA
jgi:chromatin remodeling complex protein RSC6